MVERNTSLVELSFLQQYIVKNKSFFSKTSTPRFYISKNQCNFLILIFFSKFTWFCTLFQEINAKEWRMSLEISHFKKSFKFLFISCLHIDMVYGVFGRSVQLSMARPIDFVLNIFFFFRLIVFWSSHGKTIIVTKCQLIDIFACFYTRIARTTLEKNEQNHSKKQDPSRTLYLPW